MYEKIRNFAVMCLKSASIIEIKNYIIQLIQCLKFKIPSNNRKHILLVFKIRNEQAFNNSKIWIILKYFFA